MDGRIRYRSNDHKIKAPRQQLQSLLIYIVPIAMRDDLMLMGKVLRRISDTDLESGK